MPVWVGTEIQKVPGRRWGRIRAPGNLRVRFSSELAASEPESSLIIDT